jgi:ABC-type multidrug transport system ATPase subunit
MEQAGAPIIEPIIELKNIVFTAQRDTILRGLSLRFFPGRAAAIVGSAGSGKSSALKIAAGILVPDEGRVLYKGEDTGSFNRAARINFHQKCAFVFQDSALWANQTLKEILELPLSVQYPHLTGEERAARIAWALDAVGYKKELEIRPDRLSTGEQKLIAFARAMLSQPELLFLDEWTESLDDDAARRLFEIVLRYKGEQKTIIFISHNAGIVRSLADTIFVISRGALVETVDAGRIAAYRMPG